MLNADDNLMFAHFFSKCYKKKYPIEYLIIMPLHIERNRPFLELLTTTKDKEQKQALIETATPGQLRALCECVRNICKGRFNFTPAQKKSY